MSETEDVNFFDENRKETGPGHTTPLARAQEDHDDRAGVTLAAASTTSKATPDRDKLAANAVSAKSVGSLAAQAALAKGIKQVVFDRGGARYHGKVKALADAAREAGLQF